MTRSALLVCARGLLSDYRALPPFWRGYVRGTLIGYAVSVPVLILLALLLSALLAGCAPEPEEGLPPNVEAQS